MVSKTYGFLLRSCRRSGFFLIDTCNNPQGNDRPNDSVDCGKPSILVRKPFEHKMQKNPCWKVHKNSGIESVHRSAFPVSAEIAGDFEVDPCKDALKKPPTPHHWRWLDQHPEEQSLVWLGQSKITALKTLDQGHEIEIPDASLQDWLRVIFLDGATLQRVRDFALNYADYKYYFKQYFIASRLVKRDGDTFDGFLRLSRKQFATVILNINVTASYVALDPTHGYIICHSTHIGEVAHPKTKEPTDQERPPSDAYGYMWRDRKSG